MDHCYLEAHLGDKIDQHNGLLIRSIFLMDFYSVFTILVPYKPTISPHKSTLLLSSKIKNTTHYTESSKCYLSPKRCTRWGNFSYKGENSKYFKFCGPFAWLTYWTSALQCESSMSGAQIHNWFCIHSIMTLCQIRLIEFTTSNIEKQKRAKNALIKQEEIQTLEDSISL